MKRKHSNITSVNGCQNITKFFKATLMQGVGTSDIRDNENINAMPETERSWPEPILQRFSRMRETFGGNTSTQNIAKDKKHTLTPECADNNKENKTELKVPAVTPIMPGDSSTLHNSDFFTPKEGPFDCTISDDQTDSEYQTAAEDTESCISELLDNAENSDLEAELSFEDEDELLKDTYENQESRNSQMDYSSNSECNEDDFIMDKENCEIEVDSITVKKNTSCSSQLVYSNDTCNDPEEYQSSGKCTTNSNNKPDHVVGVIKYKDKEFKNQMALKSTLYPRNSFDEDLFIGSNPEESESDDDLLTPPPFLYDKKTNPTVVTPKKVIQPANASPSISPVKSVNSADKKYRFSLSKLLNDKKKKRIRNAELMEMEEDLDEGIKRGGKLQRPGIMSEDEAGDSEIDDGRDLSQCKLPNALRSFLVTVSDFSEDIPGEDIFTELGNISTELGIPSFSMPNPDQDDQFLQLMMTSTALEVRELLCGGWFLQYYLKRPCPDSAAHWVFRLMCYYPDCHVSTCCYQVLWSLLKAGNEDRGGIPRGFRGIRWVPNVKDIVGVLVHHGATLDSLLPLDHHSLGIPLDFMKPSKTEQDMCDMNGASDEHTRPSQSFPVYVVDQLVQFLTHCLHMSPLSYTVDHLHQLVVILCRLSLDLRLQAVVFDIELCLTVILNCFGESQWPEEVKELAKFLSQLSTNHHNLLHIVQVLPLSLRGSHLRRLLSFVLLRQFTKEFQTGSSIEDSILKKEAAENCCKMETLKVSQLVSLVEKIRPKDNSNYYLLYTITALVELAVGDEGLPPSERPDVVKLSNSLQTLNGDIKDPRAAFLDRTKVKDLLVRTVNKINFLLQCIDPPKERPLTMYFETDSSDYVVETLKDEAREVDTPSPGGVSSAAEGASNSDADLDSEEEERLSSSEEEAKPEGKNVEDVSDS